MILRLHIRNYKSFEDELIEDLSPAANFIVGRNGQGKSNFYAAIRFALTPAGRAAISAEEKRALLNERFAADELFVAVTLSNAGERFPLRTGEVTFKKRVDADNRLLHYINDLPLPGEEYHGLLECGSVGRLLRLGRLEELARLDGAGVFALLKEITGARAYERKRAESVAIMEKAAAEERVVRKRLDELELVVSKLKRGQTDYAAHVQNLRAVRGIEAELLRRRLAQTERKAAEAREAAAAQREAVLKAQDALAAARSAADAADWREEAVEEPAPRGREAEARHRAARDEAFSGVSAVTAQRARAEGELREAEDALVALSAEQAALSARLTSFVPTGRPADPKRLERERHDLQREIEQLRSEHETAATAKAEAERALATLAAEAAQLRSRGNEKAARVAQLRAKLATAEQHKTDVARSLASQPLRPPQLDLLAAQRVAAAFRAENPDEICLLLAEALEVPERLEPAVEAIAGRRLGSVVVRDEAAALRLLDANAQQAGPRLRVFPLSWPQAAAERVGSAGDAVPLRGVLRLKDAQALSALCSFNAGETLLASGLNESLLEGWREARPMLEALLDAIFGRAFLVKTREQALAYSHQFGADCVTAEGEVVFAGGFVARLGSVGAQRGLFAALTANGEANVAMAAEAEAAARLRKAVAEAEADRGAAESAVSQAAGSLAARTAQARMLSTHALSLREALFSRTRELAEVELALARALAPPAASQDPAQAPLLRTQLAAVVRRRTELERRREAAMRTLRDPLSIDISAGEGTGTPAAPSKGQHARVWRKAADVQAVAGRAERAAEETTQRVDALLAQLQQLERGAQRMAERRAALLSEAESGGEWEGRAAEELLAQLSQLVAVARSSFTERDTAIFRHLASFEEKQSAFSSQLERIDGGRRRLFDCIDRVDRRVSEVSQGFFQTFRDHFRRLYLRFEPAFEVEASLRPLPAAAAESQQFAVEFALAARGAERSPEGLFNFTEGLSRAQLSKGKRLVFALCLLLAFDAIEPAPFYLFDEFDSALDAENLGAYLRILGFLGQRAQIFFTSFRPAVLNMENMQVREVYLDRASRLRRVDYDQAARLIEAESKR